MNDDQLRRRSELIAEGLERDPTGLESWLATLGPGDAKAVRRALERRGQSGETDSIAGISSQKYAHLLAAAVEQDARPAANEGERLGAWVLQRKLGEGGMGEVWLATRADGLYKGQAAIKLLRTDLDRKLVEQRFAREREVLARLNHPNIARLLDAGLSPGDEHPFLVLEYVEGAGLLAHAQARNLDTRGRVQLARIVAEAVAYAHGRLVVHRDLKPQNILVTAANEPKVLDFGIAGLLDDETPAGEGLTRIAGRALTLEYCAPEQLTGAPADVRSDVYSLGVVLFELLTGTRPHTPKETSRRALEYSIVHEEARALDAQKFDANLVAVVARALAREPERRYPTMAAFAEDLARWLDHRPVFATTPTALERVMLWARRNRALAATTAAALLAIITGLIVSLWLAGEARQQERIAIAALADVKAQSAAAQTARTQAESESSRAEREAANAREQAAIAREQAAIATAEGLKAKRDEAKAREAESLALRANNQAQIETRKAKAVSSFVFDLFQAADPEKSKGDKLTARDILDAGAAGVDRFADQPDTRTELQRVLGTSYNALSRPEKAVPLLAAAAKAQEAEGRGSPDRARTLLALASAESDIEKFADAVEHYREALPVVEAVDGAMADEVVVGKVYYAFALCKVGKHDECIALADSVAEEVRAKVGEKDWRYVEAQNGRATARSVVGRWREMPAILDPLEPLLLNPPPGKLASALTIRANLAISTGRTGDITGAVALLGPLSEDLSKHLGAENDKTLVHTWYLAEYQRQLGRYADCQAQYAKLVEVRTRVTGATHPLTVDVLSKAALCARSAGNEPAARNFAQRAETALPAKDDPPQRTVMRTLLALANVALDLGDRDKASTLLARALALVGALKLEASDEVIMMTLIDGQRLVALGESGKALAEVETMLATPAGQRALGNHAVLGIHAYQLALTGKREAALKESEAARKLARSRLPEDHPYFAVLDYVDALATGSPTTGPIANLEKAAGRKAPLPLAPLWFTL